MVTTTKILYEPVNVGSNPNAIITVEVYYDGVFKDSRQLTVPYNILEPAIVDAISEVKNWLVQDLITASTLKGWVDTTNAGKGF